MKKQLQIGLILVMTFLYANTFGQTNELRLEKTIDSTKTSHHHFDILINVASTTLNYGGSNSAFEDSKKSIHGLQIGASFQADITKNFSIVSELYFMMKGGKLKENNPLTIQQSTLRFYTIESPLLARFNFGKVYINAGPSIAYNLFGTKKIGDESSKAISFKQSVESYKRWDAGIQMGGGYKFNTKQKSIVLDIRYTYGLSNVSYGQEIYNRNINIGLHISVRRRTLSCVFPVTTALS
jgi:hypothetical protein